MQYNVMYWTVLDCAVLYDGGVDVFFVDTWMDGWMDGRVDPKSPHRPLLLWTVDMTGDTHSSSISAVASTSSAAQPAEMMMESKHGSSERRLTKERTAMRVLYGQAHRWVKCPNAECKEKFPHDKEHLDAFMMHVLVCPHGIIPMGIKMAKCTHDIHVDRLDAAKVTTVQEALKIRFAAHDTHFETHHAQLARYCYWVKLFLLVRLARHFRRLRRVHRLRRRLDDLLARELFGQLLGGGFRVHRVPHP
jgi:hypothetical protein